MGYYGQWSPYVPVARRQAQARREMQQLRKQGVDIQPVEIEGRKIAKTFWGAAWCDQMESHGDFANRLPRGRTYVRNGSVCHLDIQRGRVSAMVSGSEIYQVSIRIDELPSAKWQHVKQRCRGQIGSLLELLQGRVSSSVMEVVTDPKSGLFPAPKEIHLDCDCPDYATMCKHVAAVLYGVGARLDDKPELLFLLRGVNHLDLVTAPAGDVLAQVAGKGGRRQVAAGDLEDVFGIDLDSDAEPAPTVKRAKSGVATPTKAARKTRAAKAEAAAVSSEQSNGGGRQRVAKKKTRTTRSVEQSATKTKTVKAKPVKKKAARQEASSAKPVKKRAAKKKASTAKPVKKRAAK